MASIVDSFKESFSDHLAILKFIGLTIPVYYDYHLYMQSKGNFTGFIWLTILIALYMLGFLLKITHNVANSKTLVLPSLNPLTIISASFKGLVAVGPMFIFAYLVANYLCSLINFIPWVTITLKTIVWIIAAAMFLTPLLTFAVNEKISEAYNPKVFFEKAGDLIFIILFFVIKFLLLNIVTIGFVGYTLLVLFGFGPIFNFFVSFALVFNIAVIGHYLGQVDYELINYNI